METETFRMGRAAESPHSTVELTLSIRNLLDLDVFSKSDPMVVLFMQPFGASRWVETARTEVIHNNLNPDFAKKFVLEYMFEEHQKCRFEVYDIDSESPRLQDHDFLGFMECSLGEIVAANSFKKSLQFNSARHNRGFLLVSAEELLYCKTDASMKFLGKKLDKKDFFGKSDPFLVISKANENSSYVLVHRTEYIKNTLNPTWKTFRLSFQQLCNGDEDRSVTVSEIRMLRLEQQWKLVHPSKKQRKGASYKNSGEIRLIEFVKEQRHSFLDYIRGGTELNCTVAIDFTASNGDPQSQTSLHNINMYIPNPYCRALRAVGEVIQDYDSDKMFPVLGFGARLPPDGRVSHEFFVNGHPSDPYCVGVDGVLQAYQQCLQRIQLYGPTNFAPVINHVARFAALHQDGSQYFILLIVTDGIITDMPQTKDAIISASVLPLSIIIVGVGKADFSAMDELDGDVVRLSQGGRTAQRDIVQFVPFHEYERDVEPLGRARLAKAVLAEIPEQFVSYMRMKKYVPKPPRVAVDSLPPDIEVS